MNAVEEGAATPLGRNRRLAWPLAIALAFAATRLVALDALPVFVDEAIHVVWASRVASEGRVYRPWQHGRALQVVAVSAVVPWAPDPVQAARVVSVLVAACGLWAAFDLGRRLFGRGAAIAAACVYVVCPFALFYDRLALADPFVATFAALALGRSLALVRAPTRAGALALAALLAATVLSKLPGLLFWPAAALPLLLARPAAGAGRYLASAFGLAAAAVAYPVYYTYAHGPVLGADRVGLQDFAGLFANVATASRWISAYMTLPLLALAGLGVVAGLRARGRESLLLALAVALPVAGLAVVAHHWAPRFLLPVAIPLCVLAGRGAVAAAAVLRADATGPGRAACLVLALLLAWPALRFGERLLVAPETAPLPAEDHFAFVEGWPSGYGTDDALRLLGQRLREQPGHGATLAIPEQADRIVERAARARLLSRRRVEIVSVNLDDPHWHEALALRAGERTVYLLLTPPLRLPPALAGRRRTLATGRKPSGELVVELFELAL